MSSYALSSEQCRRFDEDGFLTIPGLLSGEEIDPLVERLGAEPDLFCKVGALDWVFWTDPKDDLVGTLPPSHPLRGRGRDPHRGALLSLAFQAGTKASWTR